MMRETASLQDALRQLQAQLPVLVKGETGKAEKDGRTVYTWKYADLAKISQVLLPVLASYGLCFLSLPTLNDDGKFVLRYQLMHTSGETEGGDWPLGGTTPQARGSEVTYARRYALCAVTGVAPEQDDDDALAAQIAARRREEASEADTAARALVALRNRATAEEWDLERIAVAYEQRHKTPLRHEKEPRKIRAYMAELTNDPAGTLDQALGTGEPT